MSDAIIVAVITGALAFAGTWYSDKKKELSDKQKNKVDLELAYANHMPELLDKIDIITKQRDDLRDQVSKLSDRVEEQSAIIKTLKDTNQSLNNKLNRLLNKQTTERINNERTN
ncbi:hypothetical protein B808_1125 [Fructilactobacillus florum 8D]|uniref:Uncharacterized protein n=1 Tax=Fructilactobacillus florum 8D TaxID=1221538 RepID=W9EFI3_9LACO|nr:hypothetical protein [Fructilactobacillus florum]ETO40016.1 hypothetical protein B808_1125 [Fructilactobacillus florum 8D]